MPEGAISCTRPGPYGNPFKVGIYYKNLSGDWEIAMFGTGPPFGDRCVGSLEESISLFREYAEARARRHPEWLEPLRAKTLACWCAVQACEKGHRFGVELSSKWCAFRTGSLIGIPCGAPLFRVTCHVDIVLELANRPRKTTKL